MADIESCLFCGKKVKFRELVRYESMRWIGCPECGGGIKDPYISELENENANEAREVYARYQESRSIFDEVAKEKSEWILREYMGDGALIIEVGPGIGSVAEILKKKSLPYLAIEPNPEFALILRGLGLDVRSVDPEQDLIQALDEARSRKLKTLIIMDNVLEHVPYPFHILEKIRERAVAGSKILVEVPNEAGISWRGWIQDFLRGYTKPPTFPGHINLFTRNSLQVLFSRAGLPAVKVAAKPMRKAAQVAYCMQSREISFKARAVIRLLNILPVDQILGVSYWLRATAVIP